MITVSLCMIVKNEEQTINRCLSSAKYIADEIIIIDTGSTDKTKEICANYTDKIYDFDWIDDFSAARNYAYSFASMDYILWLDADDIILVDDIYKFVQLKETLTPDINTVMMKYNTGMDAKGNVTFSYYRERLTKRSMNFMWREPVHEFIRVYGPSKMVEIGITHGKLFYEKSDRNIKIYERLMNKGEKLTPRGQYYYARELKEHKRWKDAIIQFEEFLDSNKGWVEDNIAACNELSKCYFELKEENKALSTLFRSFMYDLPRAEICVRIGYYYQEKKEYNKSTQWFKLILSLEKPLDSPGFIQHNCWDYIPCIEIAVNYDRIGDIRNAAEYNNRALLIKPDSVQALLNKKYFEEIEKGKETV